jgi:hypothetical protein
MVIRNFLIFIMKYNAAHSIKCQWHKQEFQSDIVELTLSVMVTKQSGPTGQAGN